jgi:hypothetical protein
VLPIGHVETTEFRVTLLGTGSLGTDTHKPEDLLASPVVPETAKRMLTKLDIGSGRRVR